MMQNKTFYDEKGWGMWAYLCEWQVKVMTLLLYSLTMIKSFKLVKHGHIFSWNLVKSGLDMIEMI